MKKLIYGFLSVVLFSCSSVAKSDSRPYADFTVQSDIVNIENGCFTINVRVYANSSTMTYLISNTDVRVGTCSKVASNENPDCKDEHYKGDYFLSTIKDYKCLVALLKEDEVLYAKYVIEKNRLIDEFNKRNK